MKTFFKTLLVVGAASLMIAGAAYAGTTAPQRDRQHLRDATCTTTVAKGAQTGIKAQDRQRLQDGSCTAVAYRNGARNGSKAAGQNGSETQDRQHLRDGSCVA